MKEGVTERLNIHRIIPYKEYGKNNKGYKGTDTQLIPERLNHNG